MPRLPAVLLLVLAAALLAFSASLSAKTPGKTYCHRGICHRVKTVAETQLLVGRDLRLMASHYSNCRIDRFNPCGLTSSGEVFRDHRPDNAASPHLPDGTVLLLYSERTSQAAVVRVNNAGPYMGRRQLDVSRATADRLGFARSGIEDLVVRVLRAPVPGEEGYVRRRHYRPVPGFIGTHANLDAAHAAVLGWAAREVLAERATQKAVVPRQFVETLPVTIARPVVEPARAVRSSWSPAGLLAALETGGHASEIRDGRLTFPIVNAVAAAQPAGRLAPQTAVAMATAAADPPEVWQKPRAPRLAAVSAGARPGLATPPLAMVAADFDDSGYGVLVRLAELARTKARSGMPDGGLIAFGWKDIMQRGLVAGLWDGLSELAGYARRAARAGLPQPANQSADLFKGRRS